MKLKSLGFIFVVMLQYFYCEASLPAFSMSSLDGWQIQQASGLRLRITRAPPIKFPRDLTVSDPVIPPMRNWLPWNPTGMNNAPATTPCRQETLRGLIWSDRTPATQGKNLNLWAGHCYREISDTGAKRSLFSLFRFATIHYDFAENPYLYLVEATLPDGRLLTGFIALKPGAVSRPFVIAKCGVLCNARDTTAQRTFLMHLFDEAPFNVLALANNTGSDFQIDNEALSVGGFDEGRQLYQIAQILRSPESPLRALISSVHVVGISLGASGALYSGLYSSANDRPGQEHIQSVTALCPVVVVESSVKRLYSDKPLSSLANFGTLKQLRDIFSAVPILGQFFPPSFKNIRGEKLYRRLAQAIAAYYQRWTAAQPWDLKPFAGLQIQSLKEFWHVNDFRNYAHMVRIPTLTIAAENDDLVKTEENARLLSQRLERDPNSQIGTAYFKRGNHCAFAVANGWGNFSTILREYILSHSPGAEERWKPQWVRGPFRGIKLGSREQIIETQWQARQGDPYLWLKLKIYSPRWNYKGSLGCGYKNRLSAPRFCYREVKLPVTIGSLPWLSAAPPRNNYEVTSLTRWANTRLALVDREGKLVVNTNRSPEYIRAWSWK